MRKKTEKQRALINSQVLKTNNIDVSKADHVIPLKDGRYLVTFKNGFQKFLLRKGKSTLEKISDEWFKNQLKHKIPYKRK